MTLKEEDKDKSQSCRIDERLSQIVKKITLSFFRLMVKAMFNIVQDAMYYLINTCDYHGTP